MRYLKILLLIVISFIALWPGQTVFAQQVKLIAYNRIVEQVTEGKRAVIRFNEGKGAGLAWIDGMEFTNGTIEFEAKGRDLFQQSFIGIAFHGVDSTTYETVYFRPFNFRATDPARKVHAVQYSFEPKFGFQELRNTRKDEFESAIKPTDINATDWFRAKIIVKADKVTVYVNDNTTPCMTITSLNNTPTGKKIGFWVGNLSNGDFANLKISK